MWCDLQSPAMMGLQATASKRKLDYESEKCPATKVVRLEDGVREVMEDWRVDSTSSVLASSLLGATPVTDEEEDEEDDEEEEEEELSNASRYLPAGRGYYPYYTNGEENSSFSSQQQQQQQQQTQHYPPRSVTPHYWGQQTTNSSDYYGQDSSTSQQTIRCDENGKSYLDLGSSSARYVTSATSPAKCCDGSRTGWCNQGPNATCYRQRRLAVLNISMCKLGRYRQFPDPSLHRSVLICNTLRYIEREMEQEGFFFNNGTGMVQAPPAPTPPPEPSYQPHFPEVSSYPAGQYEQSLRELSASGRATPFPGSSPGYDTDSGVGDDESGRGINWGSVLSLSSQSDLDPLNNNELYPPSSPSTDGLLGDVDLSHDLDDFLPGGWKLTPLSADDLLKSVPSSRPGEGELDNIMHVLVGT